MLLQLEYFILLGKVPMFHTRVECLSIILQFQIVLLLDCSYECLIESIDWIISIIDCCTHHSMIAAIALSCWNLLLLPSRVIAVIHWVSHHFSYLATASDEQYSSKNLFEQVTCFYMIANMSSLLITQNYPKYWI